MIKALEESGIKVFRTRPYGFLQIWFLARNHKKIIIIDNTSYIGGINISDHNYSWHDMMVKFNDISITKYLIKDFKNTLKGKYINLKSDIIISNKNIEKEFNKIIINAKKEVIISSPYFIGQNIAKEVKQTKANVKILTLKNNNYGAINLANNYLYNELKFYKNIEIYFYKRFSHAKFIIVDKKIVILGSSNFGTNSFACNQEIGACITNSKFVKDFYNQLYLNQKSILIKYKSNLSIIKYLIALYIIKVIDILFIIYGSLSRKFILEIKRYS